MLHISTVVQMDLSIQEISCISHTVVLCIYVRVHLSKTLSASTCDDAEIFISYIVSCYITAVQYLTSAG